MFQQSSITPSSSTLCKGEKLGVSVGDTPGILTPRPQQMGAPAPCQRILGHVGELGGRRAPQ